MRVKILVAVENNGGNTEYFIVLGLYKPYWNEKRQDVLVASDIQYEAKQKDRVQECTKEERTTESKVKIY